VSIHEASERRTLARPSTVTLLGLGLAALAVGLVATGRITQDELIAFGVLIPSIVLHEISHGAVAAALGDDTARRAGRLRLNPLAHVDPIGTLLVPALCAVGGLGFIGWAKPVPINTQKLRSPRNATLVVSLAGPLMNLALVGAAYVGFKASFDPSAIDVSLGAKIFFYLGLTNLWLAVFNLLPIPPLDGSAVLERLLPSRAWPRYLRVRQYMLPVLMGLLALNLILHLGLLTGLSNWIYDRWLALLGV
jgi:Zn-dependent protease